MKLFLIFMCVNLVKIINSRKYRAIMGDDILDYDSDKIDHYSTYLDRSNSFVEAVDDENVWVGGYMEWVKSMDPNFPIKLSVRTKYLEHSSWHNGEMRVDQPNLCQTVQVPESLWYNVTKLWTSDVCPPKKGDRWIITNQTLSAVLDMPPSIAIGMWRAYFLLSQGNPGFEKIKMGFGIEIELVQQ